LPTSKSEISFSADEAHKNRNGSCINPFDKETGKERKLEEARERTKGF
jgi:hypothetical protein